MLIESALWEPLNIAQTGRKLGINSDARYRFERGVDPDLHAAGPRARDQDGARPLRRHAVADHGRRQGARRPSASSIFRSTELPRLAGLDVGLPEVRRVLGHLGFFVAGQGKSVKIAVPSWRGDVEGKADIVEEVVRIVGVDRVPATPFERGEAPRKPVLTPIQVRTRKAKRALAARGMVEAVTWSFIAKPQAELFGGGKPELALANPIAADLSDMRPSLLPGLIAAAQKNADRGFPDVALFEVGQIFKGDQPEDQFTAARGVRRALAKARGIGRHWSNPGRQRRSMPSTPRATRSRCSPPPARRRRRCRSCRAGRPGSIPAAPAPSRSARRTCSAISASCIRARSRRSTPKARWSPSR